MIKPYKTRPKFINQLGECFYIENIYNDINVFNWDEIWYFDQCKISDFTIMPVDESEMQRIKFVLSDSTDYAGGTVSGFLYPNGKFSGKFHVDGNITEAWSGNFLIKDGCFIIHGDVYIDNELGLGFYLTVANATNPANDFQKTLKPHNEFELSASLYNKLVKLSSTYKLSSKIVSFYPDALSLKLKPVKDKDLFIAMSIAYSWMPTMLDIYLDGSRTLKDYLPIVQNFSKIKTLEAVKKHEYKIKKDLVQLSKLVNNSVVGTSKMLHLFFPATVPIIDSRVLKGWNVFFKNEYIKNPHLKIPEYFPAKIENQVEIYVKYWKFLLKWTERVEGSTIREIEESFYWIGKNNDI